MDTSSGSWRGYLHDALKCYFAVLHKNFYAFLLDGIRVQLGDAPWPNVSNSKVPLDGMLYPKGISKEELREIFDDKWTFTAFAAVKTSIVFDDVEAKKMIFSIACCFLIHLHYTQGKYEEQVDSKRCMYSCLLGLLRDDCSELDVYPHSSLREVILLLRHDSDTILDRGSLQRVRIEILSALAKRFEAEEKFDEIWDLLCSTVVGLVLESCPCLKEEAGKAGHEGTKWEFLARLCPLLSWLMKFCSVSKNELKFSMLLLLSLRLFEVVLSGADEHYQWLIGQSCTECIVTYLKCLKTAPRKVPTLEEYAGERVTRFLVQSLEEKGKSCAIEVSFECWTKVCAGMRNHSADFCRKMAFPLRKYFLEIHFPEKIGLLKVVGEALVKGEGESKEQILETFGPLVLTSLAVEISNVGSLSEGCGPEAEICLVECLKASFFVFSASMQEKKREILCLVLPLLAHSVSFGIESANLLIGRSLLACATKEVDVFKASLASLNQSDRVLIEGTVRLAATNKSTHRGGSSQASSKNKAKLDLSAYSVRKNAAEEG